MKVFVLIFFIFLLLFFVVLFCFYVPYSNYLNGEKAFYFILSSQDMTCDRCIVKTWHTIKHVYLSKAKKIPICIFSLKVIFKTSR